jgi:hypothetical protein
MIENMRNTRRLWSVSSRVVVVSVLACGRSPSLPACYGDVVRGPCVYVPPPEPLLIVDGRPWKKDRLVDIDPSRVDTVIVLHSLDAIARYGKAGRNGAVLITLKH